MSRFALNDARGIFCTFVCEACEADKRKRYRAEVLENPSYAADDLGDDDEAAQWWADSCAEGYGDE